MKYQIKYNYNDGDSFNNYLNQEAFLEVSWENLDVAKANLKRIEEHYRQYLEVNRASREKKLEIYEANKTKDWFAGWKNDTLDETSAEHSLVLYTDDGTPWCFWVPWCGYFESLNGAEILPDNSDMKIDFSFS